MKNLKSHRSSRFINWPENLHADIIERHKLPVNSPPEDLEDSINYVLQFINPNDAELIRGRYQYGNTLRDLVRSLESNISVGTLSSRLKSAVEQISRGEYFELIILGLSQVEVERQRLRSLALKGHTSELESLLLSFYIERLNLSMNCYHRLKSAKIHTLSDLFKRDIRTIMEVPRLGEKCLQEIVKSCDSYGLKFPAESTINT